MSRPCSARAGGGRAVTPCAPASGCKIMTLRAGGDRAQGGGRKKGEVLVQAGVMKLSVFRSTTCALLSTKQKPQA